MDYAKALAEGKALLTRSEHDQWALARLTHRVVVMHGKSMAQWSRDLGVSPAHVSNLRNVWDKFGDRYDRNDLTNQTFNECYVVARASAERAERIQREAEESGRSAGTVERTRDRDRDHEQDGARTSFRDRLADRAAMKDAMRDPVARRRLREFVEEEFPELRRREDLEGREPADPDPERPATHSTRHQLERELRAIRDRMHRVLGRMLDTKLTKADRAALRRELDELQNALDWMSSHVDSGDTSFEDTLERILSEGGGGDVVDLPETTVPATPAKRTPPADRGPDPQPEPPGEGEGRERRPPRIRNGPKRRDRDI